MLDAVGDLLAGRGWGDVSMAEVAARAGVSRQTVYNELGSREGLARAYVLREADRFLAAVEDAAAEHVADPRAALSAAFALFLTAAAEHPLIAKIASGEDESLLELLHDAPVIEHATARLSGFFTAQWTIARRDAHHVADTVVRLALSHATRPAADGPPPIARLLGPFVEQAVG